MPQSLPPDFPDQVELSRTPYLSGLSGFASGVASDLETSLAGLFRLSGELGPGTVGMYQRFAVDQVG